MAIGAASPMPPAIVVITDAQAPVPMTDLIKPPRTYHFSSESATVAARSSGIGIQEWEMMSRGLGINTHDPASPNDRVDLDLSFDFVSQLEASKKRRSNQVSNKPLGIDTVASEPEVSPKKPRGMSETMSSLRKRPPKPLSLLKLGQKQLPKSAFSPMTADSTAAIGVSLDSAALPLTPLSATRRAADCDLSLNRPRSRSLSGSQPPPTRPPTTPLPPLPASPALSSAESVTKMELVRLQRSQKSGEQLAERMKRESFVRTSQLDVKSPSTAAVATPHMPAFAMEVPQAPKKAAATKRSNHDNVVATKAEANQATNSLGLSGMPLSPSPFGLQQADTTGMLATANLSSPTLSHLSTPGTTFSSLFEGHAVAPSSESSKATSLDQSNFGSPQNGGKLLLQGGGIPMSRGSSAPLKGAISEEEECVDAKRRHISTGLTRSETAEWIRAQHESRQREHTTSSQATTSTTSSGEVQQLVLNTSNDSPVKSNLDAQSAPEDDGTKSGPWPQSPLLLPGAPTEPPAMAVPSRDGINGEDMQTSESGVGLGLIFDASDNGRRQQNVNSVLTIGDARPRGAPLDDLPEDPLAAPGTETDRATPRDTSGRIMASESQSSSVEGFAWNVTPSLNAASQMTSTNGDEPRGRFGSKIWKAVMDKRPSISHERSNTVAMDSPMSPSLRPLTLVKRNEDEINRRRASRGLSMDLSRRAAESPMLQALREDSVAPHTAPLPDAPRFPTAAVPTTFESSRRSSKHVRRTSRIAYIPDDRKEVRLDIPTKGDEEESLDKLVALADMKSPRPAPSPSGETPDMLYGHPRSGHSWGFLPKPKTNLPWLRSSSASQDGKDALPSPALSSPVSPMLDFAEDGSGLKASQERFELLNKSKHVATQSIDNDTTMTTAGLRKRSGVPESRPHSVASVPPTATVRAFAWRGSNKRASISAEIVAHEGGKLAEIEETATSEMNGQDAVTMHVTEDSPRMSIFVPIAALQAHLRNKTIQEREARAHAANAEVTTYATGPPQKSLIAVGNTLQYSAGRLLDLEQPSRTLFFAGFLCMPWLWLIGGWWLANDGLMLTPGAEQVEFWNHQPSMEQAQQKSREQHRSEVPAPMPRASQRILSRLPSPEPDFPPHNSRLDTIYSESAALPFTMDMDALSDPSDDVNSSSNDASESSHGATGTLMTARSQPTLAMSDSNGGAAFTSPSSRTLFTSDTSRIPLRARNSLNNLLNPHPEVALYHSPVRTVDFSGSSASGTSVMDLAAMAQRHNSSRQSLALRARQQSRSTVSLAKPEYPGDDSGVDLTMMDASMGEPEPLHDYAQGNAKRLTYRGSRLYDVNGTHMRYNDTSIVQRLAATEKFVLMNRFMAIVSAIGTFAAMGVALNAVALNF